MSKFNLKTYKKQDGDVHTNKMLEEQHVKAPEQVTDKQLDKDKRIENNPDSVTEKQLDSVRAEDEGRTIEGRLNKAKGRFDIKHRNKEAYTGDINKVEEQRIAGDKNEDEKYELASDTNKELRWWEAKTDDGLKLAAIKQAMQKVAQFDPEDEDREIVERPSSPSRKPREELGGFKELGKHWQAMEEGVDDTDPGNEFFGGGEEDFPVEEDKEDPIGVSADIYVAEKKDPIPSSVPGLGYAAYYSFGYDPVAWKGNEDGLRRAIVEKLLEIRPDLEGKIDEDYQFLSPGKKIGTVSYYNLRLLGDEFAPGAATEDEGIVAPEEADEFAEDETFTEVDFGESDIGGTKVLMGKVQINAVDIVDDDQLASQIAEFVKKSHPEVDISPDSIEIDQSREFATFVVSPTETATETVAEPEINEPTPTDEFPIIDETPEAPEAPAAEQPVTPEEETFEFIDDEPPSPPKGPVASSNNRIVVSQNQDTKKK